MKLTPIFGKRGRVACGLMLLLGTLSAQAQFLNHQGPAPYSVTAATADEVVKGLHSISGPYNPSYTVEDWDKFQIDVTIKVNGYAVDGFYAFTMRANFSYETVMTVEDGAFTSVTGSHVVSWTADEIRLQYGAPGAGLNGNSSWVGEFTSYPSGARLSTKWFSWFFPMEETHQTYINFLGLHPRWSTDANVRREIGHHVTSHMYTIGASPDRRYDRYVPYVPCEDEEKGMPGYQLSKRGGALLLGDRPLVYQVPRGPEPEFELLYNSAEREDPLQGQATSFGPGWLLGLMARIEDGAGNGLEEAILYQRDAGIERYEAYQFANTLPEGGLNPDQGYYRPGNRSGAFLAYDGTGTAPFYQRELVDGTVETYGFVVETGGKKTFYLTRIEDPSGNALVLNYDTTLTTAARLVSMTDALGQTSTFTYGNTSYPLQPTRITDPFGRFADFAYTAAGRLASITDAVNLTSTFTYDATGGWIDSMTTPYGTTAFEIEDTGGSRSVEVLLPDGSKERVEYHPFIDASLAPASDPSPPSASGLVVDNTELNRQVTFYWSRKAMKMAENDQDVPGTAPFYAKAEQIRWVDSPYGGQDLPYAVKKPLENRTWFNYRDANGDPVASYANGTATTFQPAVAARLIGSQTQVFRAEHNFRGLPLETTDPLGRSTAFDYSANGIDLEEVRQTTGSIDETLAVWTYNTAHQPLTFTDAAGETTVYTYTPEGQLETLTNALNEITTWHYDANGNYLESVDGALAGTGDSTTYTWEDGMPETVTGPDGYVLTYTFDNLDRLTRVDYPDTTYEQIGWDRLDPETFRDRLGRITTRAYNSLRQLESVTDPENRTTLFEYCRCGALKKLTDAAGNITQWGHDVQGRLISKTFADTTLVTYGYDALGRLEDVTDAKGQTRHWTYHLDNTVEQIDYLDAAIATPSVGFAYDPSYRRLLGMSDGTGSTAFAYHPVSTPGALRPASADGPLADDVVSWTYDELGRRAGKEIDLPGTGTFAETAVYDVLGRLDGLAGSLGTFDLNYVGATGRLDTVAYPNGESVAHTYLNNLGDRRLESITHQTPGSDVLVSHAYATSVAGEITRWDVGRENRALLVQSFTYDNAGQLKRNIRRLDSATGTLLNQTDWDYDDAGNRTGETITAGGAQNQVKSWTANNLNQLTARAAVGTHLYLEGELDRTASVTLNGSAAASLDSGRLFKGWVSAGTPAQEVDVVATDGTVTPPLVRTSENSIATAARTLQYDLNGNMTSDGVKTYEWDGADRLVAVEYADDSRSEWAYDGMGRRASLTEKDPQGAVTRTVKYVWDGLALVQQRDLTANVTTSYAGFGQQVVNHTTSTSSLFYFSRDHLGSVRAVTDAAGALQARYDYGVWGERSRIEGTGPGTEVGYTGHYHHARSGLHLAPYRAYDSDLGRWLSRDPIEEEGGINLYGYVTNNPINAVDPDGRVPKGLKGEKLIIHRNPKGINGWKNLWKEEINKGVDEARKNPKDPKKYEFEDQEIPSIEDNSDIQDAYKRLRDGTSDETGGFNHDCMTICEQLASFSMSPNITFIHCLKSCQDAYDCRHKGGKK